MTDILRVRLHGHDVGEVIRFGSGRIQFEFDAGYVELPDRPTLSQSFIDGRGDIVDGGRATTSGEVPPFFSNLLPEGRLRTYLADKAGVRETREFELLELLGADLPGAVEVHREGSQAGPSPDNRRSSVDLPSEIMRFSLAGVQLKFSAVEEAAGGLTIPVRGTGGDWIVKLPSIHYGGVPENEYSTMSLARMVGIDTPETRLVPMDQIEGLPSEVLDLGNANALAVRRFDRNDGERVHMEDFAQALGQRPADKYDEHRSYTDLAYLVALVCGEASAIEFSRRLMFNAIAGNGDMHLKNWSLLYADGRTAKLSPAYDLLCTTVYIEGDNLALRLGLAKRWNGLTLDDFAAVAEGAGLNSTAFVGAAVETVERFRDCWEEAAQSLPVDDALRHAVRRQLETVPAITGVRRVGRRRPKGGRLG
ncbi:MAG: type II toxin-antitoxin system HipA family toxin [Gammaproteobacteria bacterium]|nr:type II toxin-antitoxin system HipA family toxin [Gammaproteobacteria bacterium]